MFLLLVSFSISFGAYFLREKLKQLNLAASQLQQSSHADGFLEAVNLDIHQWTWVPTFLKVYFIGVVETIYITLCQRGLFKSSSTRSMNESHVDTLALGSKNDGSIAVITGGDSGIGLEICRGLLDAGFHVIIGTHSVKSCEAVIDSLQKATSSDKISSIQLDLTNYQSVRDFVDQIQLKVPKKNIQLLINNAGIMNTDYKITDDGFESQCQTNFLSPMLLTRLLLPYISPKSGRVLFASSSTLYTVKDLDLSVPLKKYGLNGLDHYAYSKSCIAQLVPRLAKTTPVKIYAYHPGTVRTKLFSTTTVFNLPLVSRIFHYIMLSPKEGCRTPLFLCLSKDVGDSGTYWANENQQTLPSVSVNGIVNNNEALWIDTMQKINLKK